MLPKGPAQEAKQIAETLLQSPVQLRRLAGGLVHFVYLAANDSQQRVIVKVRGTHYARLRSLPCEPTEIQREITALLLLNDIPALKGIVPRLIYSDSARGHIVMTEVEFRACSLAVLLRTRKSFPPGMARLIGSQLALCHVATTQLTGNSQDEPFFERELSLKLLRHHQPVLEDVASMLRGETRRFVLGDRSPKNIIIGKAGTIYFIDFDGAHFGSQLFEMAYTAAHLLLHGAALGQDLGLLHSEFLCGYKPYASLYDESLYVASVIGALLYRLNNAVIPYRCQLSPNSRKRLASVLLDLLSRQRQLGIDDLLDTLAGAAIDRRLIGRQLGSE